MGSPRRRAVVTLALACVPLTTAFASASPALSGTPTVCTGTVQVGYLPAIKAMPAPGPTAITLSTPTPLSCTGASATGTATITAAGTNPAGAACTGPIAVDGGTATVTLTGVASATGVWEAAGTTAAQSWLFVQAGASPSLEAAGGGAWTTVAADIGGCLAGATSITFFAAIVIVT
jgi:hypothetical protein